MAHFYMVGRNFTNNPVTRRGFAKHGIEVEAQSNFGKVVTKLSLLKNYCPAEEYHQKYLEKR